MKKIIMGMSAVAIATSFLGGVSFADGLKTVSTDKLPTVGALEEQRGATITIKEMKKDSWGDNVKFELKLPSNIKWNEKTTINGDHKPTIKDNVLTFTTKPNASYEDSLYIIPYMDIDRKSEKGNISVLVYAIDSMDEDEAVDIATLSDRAVSFSSSYKKVQKNTKFPVEFTLSEAVENSLLEGSVYDIVLENASIEKGSVKIFQEKGKDMLDITDQKDDYVQLNLKEKDKEKSKWKISMNIMPNKDYTGDIMAKFEGRGIENVSTTIANVYEGISSSKSISDTVYLGMQDQKIKTVSISEATAGTLKEGDYILKLNPNYKGLVIKSATLESDLGDIRLSKANIDGNTIKFKVKGSSTKPSEIKLSDVTVTIDPFGYEGEYKFELVNEKNPENVLTNVSLFNAVTAKKEDSQLPMTEKDNIKFVIGSKSYSMTKDNKTTNAMLDVAPYIAKGNRTMLPLRAVAESLDMNVEWNAKTNTATLTTKDKNTTIILTKGNKTMLVNGEKVMLDSAPEIKDSRTFLPVAQIAKAVSVNASWDNVTKTVTLTK